MLKTVKVFLFALIVSLSPISFVQAEDIRAGKIYDFSELTHGQSPRHALDNLIKNNNVVIDFYAHWCGPCKQMKPIFKSLAQDFTNVIFVKLDIEEYSDIARDYNIRSIPTFLFFRHASSPVTRISGAKNKATLAATLNTLYSN